MILVRSPLRITLGGGGTDLPSYYRTFGGMTLSAAIDKYVYVSVSRPFVEGIILKYSEMERVSTIDAIQHPIFREALRHIEQPRSKGAPQIEIASLADIPAGMGLGSSGSFTTALVRALYTNHQHAITAEGNAVLACEIEMNILQRAVGKQDAYSASYGGVTAFTFCKDEQVQVERLRLSPETRADLEDNLLLFFTGFTHDAHAVLSDPRQLPPAEMTENLHQVKALGMNALDYLQDGRLSDFAALLTEQWELKKRRAPGMTNGQIDQWRTLALRNGALGAKLVGAGGGGFLLVYTETPARVREAMRAAGVRETRFRFDDEGTKVLLS